MNVYIDCGATDGDTLNCEKLMDFKADYKIAFEPNPRLYRELCKKPVDEAYNYAVWTENTEIELSVHRNRESSSVMTSKETFKNGRKIKVQAIDFGKFIEIHAEDNICVKMDIEGAEFPVLESLIERGLDKYINLLYLETHENKVRDYTTTDKEELLSSLRCKVIDWRKYVQDRCGR